MLITKEMVVRLVNKFVELNLLECNNPHYINTTYDSILASKASRIEVFLKPVTCKGVSGNLDVVVLIKKKRHLYRITIKYMNQKVNVPDYKETMHNIEQVIDKLNTMYNVNIELDYILNTDEELIECKIPYNVIKDYVEARITDRIDTYTRAEIISKFKIMF